MSSYDLILTVTPTVTPKNTDRQWDIGNLLRKNCYIYRRKKFTFFTRYNRNTVTHPYISLISCYGLDIHIVTHRNIIDGFYGEWLISLCFWSIIIAVFLWGCG